MPFRNQSPRSGFPNTDGISSSRNKSSCALTPTERPASLLSGTIASAATCQLTAMGARVADAPTQPGGHQRLVQIVAVDCSFDREIRDIESRPLGAAPVAVNPSAVDTDPQRWSQQAKKRPTEPVVDDIAALIGAFGACEQRQYRFIGDGRIVERKRAGKKSVARDAMRVGETRRGRHRRCDQE